MLDLNTVIFVVGVRRGSKHKMMTKLMYACLAFISIVGAVEFSKHGKIVSFPAKF